MYPFQDDSFARSGGSPNTGPWPPGATWGIASGMAAARRWLTAVRWHSPTLRVAVALLTPRQRRAGHGCTGMLGIAQVELVPPYPEPLVCPRELPEKAPP